MLQNRCFTFMFHKMLLPYNRFFLVWKQPNLRFSVYNGCYLFKCSADTTML